MSSCKFNSVKASNGEQSNLYDQLANKLGQEEGMKYYLQALQLKNNNVAVIFDANSEPVVNVGLQQALGLVLTDTKIYQQTNLIDMIGTDVGKYKVFTKAEQARQLARVNKELLVIDNNREAIANSNGTITIQYKVGQSQSPFTGVVPTRIVGNDKDNVIALKNYQILQANKRISEIKIALKDTTLTPTAIQALVREKTETVDRVRQLRLDDTKINTAGTFTNFFDIAQNDISLIASLVTSNKLADLEQANILMAGLECADKILEARIARVDPDGKLSDALKVSKQKTQQIQLQLQGSALGSFADLSDQERLHLDFAAKILSASHTEPELSAAYDMLMAIVIKNRKPAKETKLTKLQK